ncbi:MAG: hypothetical protein N2114_06690 [Candidatus Goldbacteria bacterium]|nr:hypothetical protein [Candidatus Goldiibacteriota bacterium]
MKNLLIVNILFCLLLFNFIYSENIDSKINTFNNKTDISHSIYFGFSAFIQYGESNGTAIAPENEVYDNKGAPYEMGYGFAGHILYALSNEWKIFLEIGYSDRRILCARKDEYGIGSWIADMTGNTFNFYGPFDSDVYFYMNTFIIKAGVKYYILNDENLKPWFGVGLILYPWNASYMNAERSKIWGSLNGICFYLSFLNFGIDMNIDLGEKEKIIFSLYADLGAPSVQLKFNNLFQNGWNYVDDSEDVIAPYKFGLLLLFEL